jgi:DNA-binding response OmpR family regulator
MGLFLKIRSKTADEPTKGAEKQAFASDCPQPAPDNPSPAIGQNRKILVADDNSVVLKAFEMKLKASGFEVFTAQTAEAVAGKAAESGAELIILDINFPAANAGTEWNGFSVMGWLRRFPELSQIPVILISGADSSIYKEKSLAAGAVAFFQKPVDFSQLLNMIVQTLGLAPGDPFTHP